MSSKLDYLSKYTDGPVDAKKDKKHKKHKKSKTSKKHTHREEANSRVHDDEQAALEALPAGDAESEDDDRPLVVSAQDAPAASHQPRGSWQTEEELPASEQQGQRQENEKDVGDTHRNRKRYDSDDVSEPKRGRRYDSDDDDRVETRRKRRHDSDEDEVRAGRRKRYDSDENGDQSPRIQREKSASPPSRRRRHDSDHDDNDDKPPHVKREQSASPPSRRRRYDSDDDQYRSDKRERSTSPAPTPQRRRYDSDDKSPRVKRETSASPPTRRRRYDSDDDSEPRTSKRRYDSDDSNGGRRAAKEDKERMSSGHMAGLQQAQDFRSSEKGIQEQKQKEAKLMVDKYGMGETVYRDKDGKKTDKASSLPDMDPEVQRQLNLGRKQREAQEAAVQEMQILQHSTFARHADDDRLEDLRKSEIRKDDPMAAYAYKKTKKQIDASGVPQRPVYKGPPPRPNRYGIRPGYRWDGVDRANSFEDKLLNSQFNVKRRKEEAYKYTSADM